MLVTLFLAVVLHQSVRGYSQEVYPLSLGDTPIQLIRWSPGNSCDQHSPYRLLNLHQNENASVVAAKAFLLSANEGCVFYFNKTLSYGLATRGVYFKYAGQAYSFDPNRIFTSAGIKATLSPYTVPAANLVTDFAQQLLTIYGGGMNKSQVVIAIHNNALSGALSARSYLPSGIYHNDAIRVIIPKDRDPKFFFLVTNTNQGRDLFNRLCLNFAGVLQSDPAPQGTLEDDGSLSYYAAQMGLTYVNVEAQAPDAKDTSGQSLINQLIMFQTLREAMRPYKY